MVCFSICLNSNRKTSKSPLKLESGPVKPGHGKASVNLRGVAKMIQFSGKYGFFVTISNCNEFAIPCLKERLSECNSFVMSKNQLSCYCGCGG